MNIEIKDSIILEEIGDLPEQLGSNLQDFLITAIRNQIKIANVVLEYDIEQTEEVNEFPVYRHEVARLLDSLKLKAIEAEVVRNPEDKSDVRIKAKISSRDFDYLKKISRNHKLDIPIPPAELDSSAKRAQLKEMYHS